MKVLMKSRQIGVTRLISNQMLYQTDMVKPLSKEQKLAKSISEKRNSKKSKRMWEKWNRKSQ